VTHYTTANEKFTRATYQKYVSAEDVQSSDQLRDHSDVISEFIDFLTSPDSTKGLSAQFHSRDIGRIAFVRMFFPRAMVCPRWNRPRFSTDDWYVVLTRSTSSEQAALTLSTSLGTNTARCSLAIPLEEGPDGNELLMLTLPRDVCEAEMSNPDRAYSLNLHPAIAALLANYMIGLARQLPHISGEHTRRLTSVTSSLVTACVIPSPGNAEAAMEPVASLLAYRALHVVRCNMASSEFDTKQLCRLLAVSRSKLYRIFRYHGGVARFINRERLRDALRRLSDPANPQGIRSTAHDVGFEDHSTFSRAFRREFGYSPREARTRALFRSHVSQ
jgi:AraC-like DNA-binding protein